MPSDRNRKETFMTSRWVLMIAAMALVASVGTAAAMPSRESQGRSAAAGAPDIRPYLDQAKLPALPSVAEAPGYDAYRPGQSLPEYMVDDCEAPALNDQLWLRVFDLDLDPMEYGEFFWALSSCRSNPAGGQSFWAIGGGFHGQKLPCGATYPNGAASA